jgi:hypothetical protein
VRLLAKKFTLVLPWGRCGVSRVSDDLPVVDGAVRSVEWFWAADGTMPGLDAFETLNSEDKAAVIAALRHWADLPYGKRALESRINEENANPKILAVKAGKHRFTMFHGSDDTWVIHRYYPKGKTKLDKVGTAVVRSTKSAIADYEQRVKDGRYYERD